MIKKPDGYNLCDYCASTEPVLVIEGYYTCAECDNEIVFCEKCLHKLINALYDWKVEQDNKKET